MSDWKDDPQSTPLCTRGTSPSEFSGPQTLWSGSRKLWRRWLWKTLPSVMMVPVFPAHLAAKVFGVLEPRKSPYRQPLLGWGLELVGTSISLPRVQLEPTIRIQFTLVSSGSGEGWLYQVDCHYADENPMWLSVLLLRCYTQDTMGCRRPPGHHNTSCPPPSSYHSTVWHACLSNVSDFSFVCSWSLQPVQHL